MAHEITQPKFKLFDKYDFVKSYVSISHSRNEEDKKEREEEAALIANAIKETQNVLLENLATKEDIKALEEDIKALELATSANLKAEIKMLEYKLMVKGGIFMTVLITFAPKLWKFLEMGGF